MTPPDAAAGALGTPALQTPALLRRLLCMLYEGVLLFGVIAAAGLLYAVATDQRHALAGQQGLQALLFVVLAGYFVHFWSTSGQTLAMQTWRIRLVTREGTRVPPARAFARYLCAWVWFVPALVALGAGGLGGQRGAVVGALVAGAAAYAALTLLHPQRQYWHDAACGTRLVTWPPQRPA